MKRLLARLHLPAALLVTFLQRAPVLRFAAMASPPLVSSPAAAILQSAAATLAALGATHSLAGATQLSSSARSPLAATVDMPLSTVVFAITGAPLPASSWVIGGSIPPGLSVSGRTTAGTVEGTTLTLTGTPTAAGAFTLSLTAYEGPGKTLTSATFFYTVNVAASAVPVFTTQPQGQPAIVGSTVTLTAIATNSPTYQWRKNNTAIPGATSATLTFPAVQLTDAGTYALAATAAGGTTLSSPAVLAVSVALVAPVFTVQPLSSTVTPGGTVVFAAAAEGVPAPSFQWRKNGTALPGAIAATLVLSRVAAADAGTYALTASNSAGVSTTAAATLALSATADFGRLTNLSIRTTLAAGEAPFTVGTVIGGTGTIGSKPLLIRAAGPALAAFGLTTALADPTLQVFNSSSAMIDQNDNWAGTSALTAAFAQVGAFAYASPTSRDAAALESALAPGGYTVQVSGVGDAAGTVLAELYDATPRAAFTAATPRLINVSVRKTIPAGGLLIAGFVIGGSTAKTVLVRAIGPGLAAFGVSGTMPDPKLELYSGTMLLAANDNWGGDSQLTIVGAAVGAFALADPASKDAMLLLTLAPGAYTAQVSGTAGSAGEALVEVYEVP